MAQNNGHLIALNNEYMYSYMNGRVYAPLRIDDDTVKNIQDTLNAIKPEDHSCVNIMSTSLSDGKLMLTVTFNYKTKCTDCLNNPSARTKNEMCIKSLCQGKCSDKFMCDTVGKYVLPDLYNNKQK